MRRLHLAIGALTILGFLITGQVMRHHSPPMDVLDPATRLLFRSRHIYILGSGLVQAMLGLYFKAGAGWRRVVQTAGSILLFTSPALLILAFFTEPARGFQPDNWASSTGLFVLFGGSMMHLACYHR